MIYFSKIKVPVLFIFVFLILSTISQAFPGAIDLNPFLKSKGQLKVYQNAYVEISNSFSSVLYDITVMESPSQKRVLSIADFQSGQSFEMSFSKVGEYEICYSSQKDAGGSRTCLQIDVLKAKLI